MLADEDPLVQRIETILNGREWLYLCIEWSGTIFEIEIARWGSGEGLRYTVEVGDGERSTLYLRGMPVGATWLECPKPNIERGWWRLSSCGVEFLDGLLSAAFEAAETR